jgi:hypothetical protein
MSDLLQRLGDAIKQTESQIEYKKSLGYTLHSEGFGIEILRECYGHIEKLEARVKELESLLDVALCPNTVSGCDNAGTIRNYGYIEQCQWCSEKLALLPLPKEPEL